MVKGKKKKKEKKSVASDGGLNQSLRAFDDKDTECPLNDCGCSAEQITVLTNAEPPKGGGRKRSFHSTHLRKAQKKSLWGWRVSS